MAAFTLRAWRQSNSHRVQQAQRLIAKSLKYLTGAEVDYTESRESSQSVIRNPNETTQ